MRILIIILFLIPIISFAQTKDYKNYDRALEHYQEWIDEGYDDVKLEKIEGGI